MVSYVTGFSRLTPQRTECKHLLFDIAWIVLQDRISAKFPRGGGGKTILSDQSIVVYIF